jgi:hypothetical protein
VSTRKFTKIAAATAGAVSLAVTLAACGSSSGGSKGSGGSSTTTVVTQTGTGARLTGTYGASTLWKWVPNGMYPNDVSETPSGAYTTGTTIKVNAKYSAASASCNTLIDMTSGPGFGEQAYMIDQGENSAKTVSYSYGAYEFTTAAQASEFVKELAARFAACGSFTYSNSQGASAPVTMGDGPSTQAAAEVTSGDTIADLRASLTYKGKTNVGDYVFAADGNVVVFANSFTTTGAVDTAVDNAKVVQEILAAFTTGETGAGSASATSPASGASWTPCVVHGQTVPPVIEYSSPQWEKACGVTPEASTARVYSTDAVSARVLAAIGGEAR